MNQTESKKRYSILCRVDEDSIKDVKRILCYYYMDILDIWKKIEALLNRNNTYTEEFKILEELEYIEQNHKNRWDTHELIGINRELQEKRLYYNISQSQDKYEEYKFLLYMERVAQEYLYEINIELNTNVQPDRPTWLQRQYTFLTGQKNSHEIRHNRNKSLSHQEDQLIKLLQHIEIQLIVYENIEKSFNRP